MTWRATSPTCSPHRPPSRVGLFAPATFAVLAHRGEDLVDAQRALARVGITAVSGGGASVLTSAAAHDWLALLEAMAAPHRSLLTRGAALTDLLGHSATELDQAGEEFDDLLAQRCRDLAGTYSRRGVAAVLEVLTTEDCRSASCAWSVVSAR